MKKLFLLFAFFGFLLTSCSDDDTPPATTTPPEPVPENFSAGSADFSNYVALGNSLTAGFSDNALFVDGQTASYPNMLATAFAEVGGGSFEIPFMADNLGGATLGGNQILGNRLILSFASGSPAPVQVEGTGTTEISNVLSGPFNNMGVPGAKSFHLVAPGYGNVQGVPVGAANPYFARFASEPNATILGDAVAQNPSFFSLWIGNNDILGYATSGGLGVDQTGNPDATTYGSNDITDPGLFEMIYTNLLGALTANGAKGVVSNLPDVTSIPFFTTVPHNPIPLDEATAGFLNSASGYGAYNAGLTALQQGGAISAEELARRTISFAPGEGNAVVIIDEDLTDLTSFNPALINIRQATAEDLLVFTSQTIIGELADPNDPTSINGVSVPLADNWVLTPEEQTAVATALASYNTTIENLANQFGLAFVDVNAILNTVASTGITLSDGSSLTGVYATGGSFSLDGIHPSPRGYGLLAGEFLKAIETTYDATLPDVEPLDFTGLYIK